jgi:hypothetical protein
MRLYKWNLIFYFCCWVEWIGIILCRDVIAGRISGGERTNIPRNLLFILLPLVKKLA